MDSATLDELRELRARAYGPSADIAEDPSALRRLRELEALRSGSATAIEAGGGTSVAAAPPQAPDPVPALDSAPHPPAVEPEKADDDRIQATGPVETSNAMPARSQRGVPGRIKVWWALSIVVSSALAAAATYGLTYIAPVSVSSGAEQIATLEPTTTEIPAGWFGAGPSSLVFDFYGLTLFQTANGMMVPGTDCFMVIATEELPEGDVDPNNWSSSGITYSGCRVGDFPATVQLPVDSSAPEEITARFPTGSALQFVLDGDRVGVFLDSE